ALIADDASYNNDAAATSGTISFSSPDLSWTGDLAPGGTATITYSITVATPDAGDKLIINSVSSTDAGSNCPPGSTDLDCRVPVPVLPPGLETVQSADTATATPGQVVHYTITATNIGQIPYTGASLSESLSGVLDDASYNGGSATAGTVSFGSPVLTWTGD